MNSRTSADLLERYDRPGPRYTSYPTVPSWTESFDSEEFTDDLRCLDRNARLSLYFHVPFCRSRCSYCGCSVVISRKPEVARRYVDALTTEMGTLLQRVPGLASRSVDQIHWGGGTPTFLAPQLITELGRVIHDSFDVADDAEISVEIDPRVTGEDHLVALRRQGFNRLSMGIQDFDFRVQEAVDRVQSRSETEKLLSIARNLGFASVNMDLIYGLPFQSVESFSSTVDAVVDMRPERIALFSYAHVPWIQGHQRRFSEEDLPPGDVKFGIFQLALERLQAVGYRHVGLDHFVLADDELHREQEQGRLHRNFQGYTTRGDLRMIGFGMTAISDLGVSYAQNHKKLAEYYRRVESGGLATSNGIRLRGSDRLRRHVIRELMCHFRIDFADVERRFGVNFSQEFRDELLVLGGFESDGLVRVTEGSVKVTTSGRAFVRNIAMVFDEYLEPRSGSNPVFSRTV